MLKRTLGRSGIEISAMGLGCWAIGGPFWRGDRGVGWSVVDDQESARAIRRALDLGVTFFDTADVYGCGHSEHVLGRALGSRRDDVVVATKFGTTFDETSKQAGDGCGDPKYVRQACTDSLSRLGTEVIDLYQFHCADFDLSKAVAVRDTLEDLVDEGKIRWYGWSTDDPVRASLFAEGPHCAAVQQRFNVLEGNREMLRVCRDQHLASVNRSCLGMGLLTGKFDAATTFPKDDVRHGWDLKGGPQAELLAKLARVRDVLTAGGRTLAQGALGWLWALSPATIPIPGFKTVKQVEENAGAMSFGPLSADQMQQIDQILKS
ncbi:MAG: aldo/keto reductase [Planctomycetes bacterium]|nr:aldo/keto reductase [Planctomycetota bacterium]